MDKDALYEEAFRLLELADKLILDAREEHEKYVIGGGSGD